MRRNIPAETDDSGYGSVAYNPFDFNPPSYDSAYGSAFDCLSHDGGGSTDAAHGLTFGSQYVNPNRCGPCSQEFSSQSELVQHQSSVQHMRVQALTGRALQRASRPPPLELETVPERSAEEEASRMPQTGTIKPGTSGRASTTVKANEQANMFGDLYEKYRALHLRILHAERTGKEMEPTKAEALKEMRAGLEEIRKSLAAAQASESDTEGQRVVRGAHGVESRGAKIPGDIEVDPAGRTVPQDLRLSSTFDTHTVSEKVCVQCKLSFKMYSELFSHVRERHCSTWSRSMDLYRCGGCGLLFEGVPALVGHCQQTGHPYSKAQDEFGQDVEGVEKPARKLDSASIQSTGTKGKASGNEPAPTIVDLKWEWDFF